MAGENGDGPADADRKEVVDEKPANVPTIKAYNNMDFLTSSFARTIRIMCEMQEPKKRLAENDVENWILFLGTHLVMHPEERVKQITGLEKRVKEGCPRDELEALSAKIRFAKKLAPMDKFYVVAMELAQKLASWSRERKVAGKPTYHVLTGGGPGIMEAANRGASSAGEMTLGFGSTRPEWGGMNEFIPKDGSFTFHYFFMRKFWMAYKCMGLVVLPGGLGSLDELFEFLQLVSSKRITHRFPIILMGSEHWRKAINFEYLVESGMVGQDHVDLMVFMDTAEEAFEYLVKQVELATATGDNSVVDTAKRRRTSPQQNYSVPPELLNAAQV